MRLFIAVIMIVATGFGENILSSYNNRFETIFSNFAVSDTTLEQTVDTSTTYPAQAMMRSLVIPGWGQIYNKDHYWKPLLFAGIEIAGIVGWWEWNQKADDLRQKYELFADDHWDLGDWITGTELFATVSDSLLEGLNLIEGHDLIIIYEGIYYPSDTLATPEASGWIDNGAFVLRNRDFYENIGKYDKFVGGWDDCWDDSTNAQLWEKEKRKIEEGYKYVVTTKNKSNYLDQRYDANTYMNMASYAVSSILLNHVVSALEAVWTAGNNNKKKSLDTSLGLMYNKTAPYGIGGVSLSMKW